MAGVQDAAVTRYEYNAFGDLTLQRVRINTIVEWQDTSFTYDAMGRRTRSVDAAGYVTTMAYDAVGNLVRTEELTGFPMAPTASPNLPTTCSTSRPASIATG